MAIDPNLNCFPHHHGVYRGQSPMTESSTAILHERGTLVREARYTTKSAGSCSVVQYDVNFLLGTIGGHLVHEIQELAPATPMAKARLDLPGGYIQSRKQGRPWRSHSWLKPLRACPLRSRGVYLRTLQSLNQKLFIHTQDHRMVSRREVNPHQIGSLSSKLRIGRERDILDGRLKRDWMIHRVRPFVSDVAVLAK